MESSINSPPRDPYRQQHNDQAVGKLKIKAKKNIRNANMVWSDGKDLVLYSGQNKILISGNLRRGRTSLTIDPITPLTNQLTTPQPPKVIIGIHIAFTFPKCKTKLMVAYQPAIATITHSAPARPKASKKRFLPTDELILKNSFSFQFIVS